MTPKEDNFPHFRLLDLPQELIQHIFRIFYDSCQWHLLIRSTNAEGLTPAELLGLPSDFTLRRVPPLPTSLLYTNTTISRIALPILQTSNVGYTGRLILENNSVFDYMFDHRAFFDLLGCSLSSSWFPPWARARTRILAFPQSLLEEFDGCVTYIAGFVRRHVPNAALIELSTWFAGSRELMFQRLRRDQAVWIMRRNLYYICLHLDQFPDELRKHGLKLSKAFQVEHEDACYDIDGCTDVDLYMPDVEVTGEIYEDSMEITINTTEAGNAADNNDLDLGHKCLRFPIPTFSAFHEFEFAL